MKNLKQSDQLTDTHGWFYDRYLAREVEAQRYLWLCGLLCVLLIISFIAWVILLPLKKTITEPYVVLIDDATGVTATLTAVKTNELAEHTPVLRYFLAKYVQAREAYHPATLAQQIDVVRAFSSPEVFVNFQGQWNETYPEEKRQTLNIQDDFSVEILSVTFPLTDIAHVRYILQTRHTGNVVNSSTWLATLKISQADEVDSRLAVLNPLGLVITNYETISELNHEIL